MSDLTYSEQQTLSDIHQWFVDWGQSFHEYRHFWFYALMAFCVIVIVGGLRSTAPKHYGTTDYPDHDYSE